MIERNQQDPEQNEQNRENLADCVKDLEIKCKSLEAATKERKDLVCKAHPSQVKNTDDVPEYPNISTKEEDELQANQKNEEAGLDSCQQAFADLGKQVNTTEHPEKHTTAQANLEGGSFLSQFENGFKIGQTAQNNGYVDEGHGFNAANQV
jgi:peptidoglycan hydrolase CwlO-like protein